LIQIDDIFEREFQKVNMEESYVQDKTFDRIDFSRDVFTKGEYENCIFKNCVLESADLSDFRFIDCEFIACNLSLAKLDKTLFRDIIFSDSKMLGLRFDSCNHFGLSLSFKNCQLDHSSFYKLKIRKTVFTNCQLKGTDFSDADLSSVVFDNCDLDGAVFDNTILEKANLLTAYNFSIDPDRNRIKKAKFSLTGLPGLLSKYDIEIER